MQDLLEPLAEESKAPGAFKTISEVAIALDVPPHVLRFWESRFSQIKPTKLKGGRRYYRPEDVALLNEVKRLLYAEGYTIEGARKALGHPAPKDEALGKERDQLAVIRRELIALSDILKAHLN